MSDNTVYLITGANRGIGHALTTLLLTRPHTTVVATSRRPSPSLTSLPSTTTPNLKIHPTSTLLPLLLDEADSAISSATLAARLAAEHGIRKLDVVVANAGGSTAMRGVLDTDPEGDMLRDFEVNAVGPAKLFRVVWPLLEGQGDAVAGPVQGQEGDRVAVAGGSGGGKRFVLITSSLGSIATLDVESMPGVAYGMSKAAANWWAKKVSVELRGRLVVGIIHPGWVQTELGQSLADAVGFPQPPMSVEESARAVLEQIDGLTPEKSGQYLTYNGSQLPW